MSEKAESTSSSFDIVKWVLVAGLLGGLVYAYTTLTEISVLYRALGAVGIVVVAGFIAASTAKGKAFLTFAKESRLEVRKVVWPTRQEVVRMTLVILVAVIIVGLLIYLFDMVIVYLVNLVMGIGA